MLPSTADTAAALAAAWALRHPGTAAPENAIVLPLAQSQGAEGSLSSYFEGTNNLGAIHAGRQFASAHATSPGYGMVAFLEHSPVSGAYIARMAVYPTLTAGAGALLDLVERFVNLATVTGPADYAAQLYTHGYYEGFHAPATPLAQRPAAYAANTWNAADQANIADYAAAIARSLPAAQAAYESLATTYQGDPAGFVSGGFAPLGARLTPAPQYAPHTLDHARELLGTAGVDPPPGGISIADCLNAPGGDGAWLFPLPDVVASSPRTVAAAHGAELVLAGGLGITLFLGAKLALEHAGILAWGSR